MKRASLALLTCALVVIAIAQAPASTESSTATIFAKIKPSLGIVVGPEGVGSAFCIASTQTVSYYLTNEHVVGNATTVTVFRQYPQVAQMNGTVVATGLQNDPDLAVVKVTVDNIPALQLYTSDLREGDPIANAGYPSAQYTLALLTGSLAPSIHLGTIATIENRGGIIEYDAQTLPGNSGGPLFDPRTGAVVGVVQAKLRNANEANIGIGIGRVVAPFLRQNGIAFTAATANNGTQIAAAPVDRPDSGIIRSLPGANTVAIVFDTSRATGVASAPGINAAAVDFSEKFAQAFHVRTILVDAQASNIVDLTQIARQHDALFTVTYGCAFQELGSITNAYGTYSRWTFSLQSALVDSYGQVWSQSGKKEKTVRTARDFSTAIASSLADLNDQTVTALAGPLTSAGDSSIETNLFRYALPLANGAKRAFFNLVPADHGAKAVSLPDFGAASVAGLQAGDTVLSVNGIATQGKNQAELTALLATASKSGSYDVVIQTADGKEQHILFEPKDLRWYVEFREARRAQQQ